VVQPGSAGLPKMLPGTSDANSIPTVNVGQIHSASVHTKSGISASHY